MVREIGRGGMGTVYLAERSDGQFEQRVAIKVIKRGMDTDAVLGRFFADRQMMARLQHPNITRLMDGGTFDHRPYFVMEYIEGEPITDYCLRHKLPAKQRIALILAVCDAVEHAHRNLILHRDIKAGKILVDAAPTPKLLDFGIAKFLENDCGARTPECSRRGAVLVGQALPPVRLKRADESMLLAKFVNQLLPEAPKTAIESMPILPLWSRALRDPATSGRAVRNSDGERGSAPARLGGTQAPSRPSRGGPQRRYFHARPVAGPGYGYFTDRTGVFTSGLVWMVQQRRIALYFTGCSMPARI